MKQRGTLVRNGWCDNWLLTSSLISRNQYGASVSSSCTVISFSFDMYVLSRVSVDSSVNGGEFTDAASFMAIYINYKHLRSLYWSVEYWLVWFSAVNYFHKKLHIRCLTGFCIHIYQHIGRTFIRELPSKSKYPSSQPSYWAMDF